MAYINERIPREEAREFELPLYGKKSVYGNGRLIRRRMQYYLKVALLTEIIPKMNIFIFIIKEK